MTEAPLPSPVDASQTQLAKIATAAALAVGLGLAVQALVLAAKLSGGANVAAVSALIDVAAGVTWSLVVCTGVAAATSALRAKPVVAGLVSMLFAPLAIALAKAVQQMLAAALKTAGQPGALTLSLVAGVKAAEYGLLGYLLATLVRRETAGFAAFLMAGLGVGVLFGGAIVALNMTAGTAPTALVAIALNEIVFPVGCAGVVYVGRMAGKAAG